MLVGGGCSFEDGKKKGREGGEEGYGRYLAEGTSGGKKLNKTALIIRRDVEEWNFYYVGMNETGLKKTDSHLFYYAYEIYNGSYVDVMLAAP